uniref:Plastid lipid-associated protein/fibrillin conserved domain-containing protein n=1 Tax=Dunaliella tertiolecta TaxID=3047 RepID=A0A7S3QMJ7_DUNTE|mmetsp:Transcript_14184/g.38429  ORF Transcript_14184/g.38429 Transcript_14184/m.38429 type:complete len:219 (-) Transcript_14184:312-968(-)
MQIMKTSHGLLPRARCSSKKRAQVHTHSFLTDALRLFPSPKPKQPAEVKLILDKIEGSRGGILTTPAEKAEITSLIESVAEANRDVITTTKKLSATWRLLWGTEKETQFICKNAGIFGTQAGEIYQVIDLDEELLQNVITFPPTGSFVVNSSISVESGQRTSFKFTGATLNQDGRKTKIPPFGKGWFETVYVDDSIRMARDIRGDYLVVARDGPPIMF